MSQHRVNRTSLGAISGRWWAKRCAALNQRNGRRKILEKVKTVDGPNERNSVGRTVFGVEECCLIANGEFSSSLKTASLAGQTRTLWLGRADSPCLSALCSAVGGSGYLCVPSTVQPEMIHWKQNNYALGSYSPWLPSTPANSLSTNKLLAYMVQRDGGAHTLGFSERTNCNFASTLLTANGLWLHRCCSRSLGSFSLPHRYTPNCVRRIATRHTLACSARRWTHAHSLFCRSRSSISDFSF